MTVGELKKQLEEMNDDDIIVMSKNAEGNNFSPLVEIGFDLYLADSAWSGEIRPREFDKEYFIDREEYEEVKKEAVKCVTLWPTN